MRRLGRWLGVLALLAVLWLNVGPAWAAGGAMPTGDDGGQQGDVVLFGQSYTLQAGETHHGSVMVFGGSVTLEPSAVVLGEVVVFGGSLEIGPEASVSGDAVVFGGSATVEGIVDGDLVVMGGTLRLERTAVVQGDAVALGGRLERDPQARVLGQTVAPKGRTSFGAFRWQGSPLGWVVNTLIRLALGVLQALALAALAALLMLFAEEPAARVGQAVLHAPLETGGVGLLALFALPLVLLFLVVTIVGIPVALVVVIVAGISWLFGWLSLAATLGERLVGALNWPWQRPLAAAFGALVLKLVLAGVGLIPCIGWVPGFVVAAWSLGAVVLTRFGMQPYQRKPSHEEESSTG